MTRSTSIHRRNPFSIILAKPDELLWPGGEKYIYQDQSDLFITYSWRSLNLWRGPRILHPKKGPKNHICQYAPQIAKSLPLKLNCFCVAFFGEKKTPFAIHQGWPQWPEVASNYLPKIIGLPVTKRTGDHGMKGDTKATLVGGWTNPFEKYARQIGSFSPNRGEHKKLFQTTT